MNKRRKCASVSTVVVIDNTGKANYIEAGDSTPIRPVVYLRSDIEMIGGTGTSTDPYVIS